MKTTAACEFQKNVRLCNSAEFQFVFEQAERYSAAGLTLLARSNGKTSARLGLALAKKNVRKATARNRLRRLAREQFRLNRQQLPAVDLILMCKPGADRLSNPELFSALAQCFQRLCQRHAPAVSALP